MITKRLQTFRMSIKLLDALDELIRPDRLIQMPGEGKDDKKAVWIETVMSWFLMIGLKGKVNIAQIETARTPDEKFELFLKYSKAMRGVKDYGVTPGKYVYSPDDVKVIKEVAPVEYQQQIHGLDDAQLKALSKAEGLHPQYMELVKQEIQERKNK